MSAIKVLVHFVWSTKNRFPFLLPEIRQKVFSHIKENALSKNIDILAVNGYDDHVHCLVSLCPSQTIETVAQLLKGESSHWINSNKLVGNDTFRWQREYFAESIGVREKGKIIGYIKKQEMHHSKGTMNLLRELHIEANE